jgi:hypothetical protein
MGFPEIGAVPSNRQSVPGKKEKRYAGSRPATEHRGREEANLDFLEVQPKKAKMVTITICSSYMGIPPHWVVGRHGWGGGLGGLA